VREKDFQDRFKVKGFVHCSFLFPSGGFIVVKALSFCDLKKFSALDCIE
jgi:hypothetical protein